VQTDPLPQIPLYDVGSNFPLEIAQRVGDRGYDLLREATSGVPRGAIWALDRFSRWWLVRNSSPYLHEIERLAERSKSPGLYYLNVNYEWGCTTGAKTDPSGRSVALFRTLDWEIRGIGRHLVAARIANPLGAWISLTWPAFTGVLQAVAPGRFAAAINQPTPPRLFGVVGIDKLISRFSLFHTSHIQPIHLLRRVFETAPDYRTALEMLNTTPVAAPVIFTLVGLKPDEAVVIERRQNQANLVTDPYAANEWRAPEWRARSHRAFENDDRVTVLRQSRSEWSLDFNWLKYPLLNDETRLAMVADATTGRLLAQGYEGGLQATRTLAIDGT
jgi:hypothetical protein